MLRPIGTHLKKAELMKWLDEVARHLAQAANCFLFFMFEKFSSILPIRMSLSVSLFEYTVKKVGRDLIRMEFYVALVDDNKVESGRCLILNNA